MAGKAIVYWRDKKAGMLSEQDNGYVFQYAGSYVGKADAEAISFTLPLRNEPFFSKTMFPFFDVALFSFLTGNADMHLKNFSLIYPVDGMVKLSPAYDLLATRLLISEKDDPEEMALTANGRKRRLDKNDFIRLAANLGLKEKQVGNVFNRFLRALPEAHTAIGYGFLPGEKTETYQLLLADRAARLGF